jgi:hypothetical protein
MAIPEDQRPPARLVGEDGSVVRGVIMGRVTKALLQAGFDKGIIETYQKEAMSGDYDNLLRVSFGYVKDVEDA